MEQSCDSCRWYHGAQEACRKYAPRPTMGGRLPPDSDKRWSDPEHAVWPHTEEHDWCGEHEAESR